MSQWKDTSSYSKSDEKRIPNQFEIQLGLFRLVVHRHKDYSPKQWLTSCHPIYQCKKLKSQDIAEAKCQAVTQLLSVLNEALRDMTQITDECTDAT